MNREQLTQFNEELRGIADSLMVDFHPKNWREHFLIYSFGKSYKTHSAILLLAKEGYGQDAAMLCRSLFELAISTLYILQDSSDKRAKRWFDYDWVRREKMFGYMESNERFISLLEERSKKSASDSISAIREMAKKAKEEHCYIKGYGWSDKKIFDMVVAVDLESLYHTVYRPITEVHHSGVGSVNDYVSDGEAEIIFDVGSSEKWIEETLVATFHFFSITVEQLNNVFSLARDKEIEVLIERWCQSS